MIVEQKHFQSSNVGKIIFSQFIDIEIRVPQGVVVGSSFFLIFMNDIFEIVEKDQERTTNAENTCVTKKMTHQLI